MGGYDGGGVLPAPLLEGETDEGFGGLGEELLPVDGAVPPALLTDKAGGALAAVVAETGFPLDGIAGVGAGACMPAGTAAGRARGGGVGVPADAAGASGFAVLGPLIVVPRAFAG